MVFGKKRIYEILSSDSDSDQNSTSDEEIPQSLPQPQVKNSSTKSHSTNETTKPPLAQEVIYTGKNCGIQRCATLLNDRETYEIIRKKVQEVEESGATPSLKCSTLRKKEKGVCSKSLEEAFQLLGRDDVDMNVMKGLCANGIPFNVLKNPQFVEIVMAINNGPKGYKPPSFDKARTVLLDECKRHVDKDLAPIKDTWFHQGVSIVSDGWSNVKHMPLINLLTVNSRATMFLYADDFFGVEKTGVAIAEYLIKAIEEIEQYNVLQVVTDNAANCKAAGKEIQKVLAMYRANSKLELLKVAKTRFASHYILLKRLLVCREALATTIVLNSWKEWIKQGDENTRKIGALVAETIGSDFFWEEVEHVVKITKPIYHLINFADGEGQKMGEFYEKMDSMLGEIQEIMKTNKYANCYSEMETIVIARWTKMNYTIHCLGFFINT
ncbi:uncharacterized protein [Cicer arietinum]|uniref:Uncharacterized protein LOC101501382 n=1 Tax=Cicer arietinum TaxID=3827 RepID=A0A1S2Y7Q0_CICAR|nr:uncharacterized protein LOC101501382 [Cicer arietinum]